MLSLTALWNLAKIVKKGKLSERALEVFDKMQKQGKFRFKCSHVGWTLFGSGFSWCVIVVMRPRRSCGTAVVSHVHLLALPCFRHAATHASRHVAACKLLSWTRFSLRGLRQKTFSFVLSFARSSRKFFGGTKIFDKFDRLDAIVLIKKSSSEPSSRFLLPVWSFDRKRYFATISFFLKFVQFFKD